MWIQRYLIIHAKVSDKTVVEEFLELKNEISKAMLSEEYSELVSEKKIMLVEEIDKLQVSQMKGWLFNFYSLTDNFEQYDRINDQTLGYQNNIRDVTSVNDIALRNLMIIDWRNQDWF